MKVLFAPIATIYNCKSELYYDSSVDTQIKRYKILGDEMSVLFKYEICDSPRGVRFDEKEVNAIYVSKINSVKSKLLYEKRNDIIIREAVKDCDLCICHVPYRTSTQTIKYAKLFHKPYVTVVVACPWDSLWNYDWRGKLLAPFAFLSLKKIQKEAKYSIYVTKEFLQHRYPSFGKQLAASDVETRPLSKDVINRRYYRISRISNDAKSFNLTTVAGLVPYKGQEYVIRAIAKLRRYGYKFTYNIVGPGSQERLKTVAKKLRIQDQILFHGVVSHDSVFDILDQTDIYIQPSKQEGLPRAMVEAMSRGCAALGSNIAGIPELVRKDCLFPKGKVAPIVRILSTMSKDKLLELANYSFKKSEEYDTIFLQKQYKEFLLSFKRDCEKIKNIYH